MGALWLGALAVGCSRSPDPREAERTVQRFFAAVPSGDCAVLRPMLANAESDAHCQKIVDELNGHGVRLIGIQGARVDGRDKTALIVTTAIEKDGAPREQPLLVRVETKGGQWRIRL